MSLMNEKSLNQMMMSFPDASFVVALGTPIITALHLDVVSWCFLVQNVTVVAGHTAVTYAMKVNWRERNAVSAPLTDNRYPMKKENRSIVNKYQTYYSTWLEELSLEFFL
eukprot:m.56462 g.56462  ORF g.56462 m.56462 type:complete len:110 (+) comp34604_c0_seq10:1226-1555(+)